MIHLPKWLRRVPALLITFSLLVLLTFLWQTAQLDRPVATSDGGFMLQPPAFLKTAYAQGNLSIFEDAGLIAYANTEQAITLSRVEPLLKSVTDQTSEYIVGVLTPPGYEGVEGFQDNTDVQIFVHQSGWIIAYLTRWQNASLAIDWINYSENALDVTTLKSSILHIESRVGASNSTVAYYHFQYPDATDLMFIADRETSAITDSFDINIPLDFNLYESSWSHVGYNIYQPDCLLGEEVLNTLTRCEVCWRFKDGQIDTLRIQTGDVQRISVKHSHYNNGREHHSACGLALVYKRTP